MKTFAGLRRIVATLRGPDGCPWDRVQTHESLRPYLLEEVSEALAAIDAGDVGHLREELGDLLLEVLLQIQIAEGAGEFTLEDVVHGIADKLVRRHPHVFGEAVAETPDAVVAQWDELKRQERGDQSALAGIPQTLPSIAYAQAIQRRAEKAGFAFESVEHVWAALEEELAELREAKTLEEKREEIGDALFALANLARWLDADAEDALRSTCRGFAQLFERMERIVHEREINLKEMAVEENLVLWEEVKEHKR